MRLAVGRDRRRHPVPVASHRDLIPAGRYRLAWQYLDHDCRMTRRVETVDGYNESGSGQQRLEVDVRLPRQGRGAQLHVVPVTFLGKQPVAPDLEVRDAGGAIVAIPTKQQNIALTIEALGMLARNRSIPRDPPELLALAEAVVSQDPLSARISRYAAERRMPADSPLVPLLRALEDQFVLWVPITGAPMSDHHLSVARRFPNSRNPIIYKKLTRDEPVLVATAAGTIDGRADLPTGGTRVSVRTAVQRLLRTFALEPLEFQHTLSETQRYASHHFRVRAPRGFVVRDIAIGVEDPDAGAGARPNRDPSAVARTPRAIRTIEPGEGISVGGEGSELAHVHCAREVNPSPLHVRVMFSLQESLNSLFVGAVVLTALLLWAFHRHDFDELRGSDTIQVSTAILLLGPTVASAWAIRADNGDVLRINLEGTRFLLVGSAVLSVATALSLMGFSPVGLSGTTSVQIYATAAYFAAALLAVGWVVSRHSAWLLYGSLLATMLRNYLAISAVGAVGLLIALAGNGNLTWLGPTLVPCVLALGLIAGNRAATPLGRSPGFLPVLAGSGATALALVDGHFLGFYDSLFERHRDLPQDVLLRTLAALLVLGAIAAAITYAAERLQLAWPKANGRNDR